MKRRFTRHKPSCLPWARSSWTVMKYIASQPFPRQPWNFWCRIRPAQWCPRIRSLPCPKWPRSSSIRWLKRPWICEKWGLQPKPASNPNIWKRLFTCLEVTLQRADAQHQEQIDCVLLGQGHEDPIAREPIMLPESVTNFLTYSRGTVIQALCCFPRYRQVSPWNRVPCL